MKNDLELDPKKLSKEIAQIFREYLLNNLNDKDILKIKEIYAEFHNADQILNKNLAEAINLLVDLGWDTGLKPNKERIKELLISLEKD